MANKTTVQAAVQIDLLSVYYAEESFQLLIHKVY